MSERKPLHLDTLSPYAEVMISPLILFSSLDHYIRRPESQQRVIGTLLGIIDEETGTVHVKDSFPVPHTIIDSSLAVNMDFHHNLLELHRKVQPVEVIVGWYATGADIKEDFTELLYDFYFQEMNAPPIHIMIGTESTNITHLPIKVLQSQKFQFTDKVIQQQFFPIPWQFTSTDQERITMNVLSRDSKTSKPTKILSDLDSLESVVRNFSGLLEAVEEYIDKVIEGKEKPNEEIGHLIQDSLALAPAYDPSFDKIFANGVSDLLMVLYLANLTKSNLLLAEKLQTSSTQN
eukprot:TRINITY_DN2673_c0_g1_i1.p1 TRINITY_DN2673_c0_g1~~TRINITY_DN2673_c0_g1_i1.p1  ORF type:complete len:291 (-),score=44.20 TRINITY_DN2673_c0_g1_i1:33-905(-)